jgi:hypothetical protein
MVSNHFFLSGCHIGGAAGFVEQRLLHTAFVSIAFLCIRLRDLMYLSTYYQIAGTVSSKNMQDLVHAPPSPSSHPHQSESRNDRGGLNFPRPNLTAEPGTI